jgi:ATP-dependent RNA helicase RhlE
MLRDPVKVAVTPAATTVEKVAQRVIHVDRAGKAAMLADLLRGETVERTLVFSRTKHGADRISRKLEASGIKVATLHSNKTQNHRLRSLKAFKAGEVRVLVATDIAARGIDVTGISHVVNYDFPMTNEDYVHRIGRTGRANAVGDAVSFVCPDEHGDLRSLERFIGRGLPRKRLEGFDYNGAPPPEPPAPPRGPRQQQGQRRSQGGNAGAPRGGGRGERSWSGRR